MLRLRGFEHFDGIFLVTFAWCRFWRFGPVNSSARFEQTVMENKEEVQDVLTYICNFPCVGSASGSDFLFLGFSFAFGSGPLLSVSLSRAVIGRSAD